VAALQAWLNGTFPLYSKIDLGPQRYGPETVKVVAEFQRRAGVTGSAADGRTIGPATWAALERFGYVPSATAAAPTTNTATAAAPTANTPAATQAEQWTPVVDVSANQGSIDFVTMHGSGVAGLILRATHGQTVDERLDEFLGGARGAGYADSDIGFYSFINPKRGSAQDCATATMTAIEHALGHAPAFYMLDIEDYAGETPGKGTAPVFGAAFAAWLREHIATVRRLAPTTNVIAYSSGEYWDGPAPRAPSGTRWVGDSQLASELDWIVPRYHVYPSADIQKDKARLETWRHDHAPPQPDKWADWAFSADKKVTGPEPPSGATWSGWQFSADFNGQGAVYGAGSTDLDLNIVKTEAWTRWTHPPT
jgi:GH25 family lysozyme M1 (1,4-beta-N-acetylmuramidase)